MVSNLSFEDFLQRVQVKIEAGNDRHEMSDATQVRIRTLENGNVRKLRLSQQAREQMAA
jgi:hypothetical protein